ncbi:MAG: hypothetical protein AB1607_14995 [Chloroflexota bacterium]
MANFNDDVTFEDSNPPEESSNRTFLFAAGGLGLLVLLALLCLGAYVIFSMNNNQTAEQTAIAQATQQAATIQAGLTQTAVAQALTATSGVTATLPPTNTPVVAQVSVTVSPTVNPATATVGAAFTQIAVSTQTIIPTSTALPNTGFADEVGIPGMFLASLALVVVIFLVRRLRAAPVR